jgi:hypothetical protein
MWRQRGSLTLPRKKNIPNFPLRTLYKGQVVELVNVLERIFHPASNRKRWPRTLKHWTVLLPYVSLYVWKDGSWLSCLLKCGSWNSSHCPPLLYNLKLSQHRKTKHRRRICLNNTRTSQRPKTKKMILILTVAYCVITNSTFVTARPQCSQIM